MPKKLKGKSKKLEHLMIIILPLLFEISIVALSLKYIIELESCRCFLNKSVNNETTVDRMIQMEYYFIFSLILMMLYLAFRVFSGKRIRGLEVFLMLVFLVSRLLQLYFVYLTFNVSRDISAECACSHDNLRYVLYFQAFLLVLTLVF